MTVEIAFWIVTACQASLAALLFYRNVKLQRERRELKEERDTVVILTEMLQQANDAALEREQDMLALAEHAAAKETVH